MSDLDSRLVAYADGELDAEAVREVEALVASDPQARRTVEAFRSTAGLLRAACGEHVYAAGAEALLPPAQARPRPARRRSVSAWMGAGALAASILGFVGGVTWAGWPRDDRSTLVDEVANYHAIYAREDRPLDLMPAGPASDTLAWIGQRLGRRLEVPDLAAEGLE